MIYGSKEWYDLINKESAGKWMTSAYQARIVEAKFPWNIMPESDKEILRINYQDYVERQEKERITRLKLLNIPPAFYDAASPYIEQVNTNFVCVFGFGCTGKTTLLCDYIIGQKNGIYIKASDYQRHMDQKSSSYR
jgi:hypothetical protein